jgi:alpha-tubulin suppressor-like RCC1 family protein
MSYKTLNVSNYPKLQLSAIGKPVDGFFFVWGVNSYGQLGINPSASFSAPVVFNVTSPMGDFNILQSSMGRYHTAVIRNDNTLWVTGGNTYGSLGTNDGVNRSSLVQIGVASNWAQIASGNYFNLAIQSNGIMWAWGLNSYGNLGTGDQTNRSTPTQLAAGYQSNWTQVSCGYRFSLGIQSNGTLYAWGNNSNGQCGQNNRTHLTVPFQVGSALWKQVAAGLSHWVGIQTDGTLWSCGYNFRGQLGNNSTTDALTPVQIGSTPGTWKQCSAAYKHTLALTTFGTLWACGYGGSGNLGNNSTVNRSSLIQVGSLSTWTQIACSYYSSFAIQSNNTLWSWGSNYQGVLGLNTSTNFSSPVQVGSQSNWTRFAKGSTVEPCAGAFQYRYF